MVVKLEDKINIATTLLGSSSTPGFLCQRYGQTPFESEVIVSAANDCGVWQCHNCHVWYSEEELHNDLCSACSCGDRE